MARTEPGALLTVQHRRAQLQVRTRALQDYARIWPLWRGDRDSFDRLVVATIPLVTAHHRVSATLAAAYYDTFRRAERVPGRPTPKLATFERDKVAKSLYVTGSVMTSKALAAGQAPQAAMRTALTRTSMAVTRHVLAGERETLVESSREDPQASGWMRVTSGRACSFCAMLASRGVVYSADSADFEAHDGCGCGAEVAYDGTSLPPASQRYRELWDEHAKGEADQLNAFRRALEGRQAPATAAA